jgi:two-component system sensor histidine kinase KdpD
MRQPQGLPPAWLLLKPYTMAAVFGREVSSRQQFLIAAVLVISVAAICYGLMGYIGYRVVALILLLTVSLTAMFFDILPVLFTATLSAFVWDFFFIPPRFELHVDTTEDAILLILYFVIALINAVLTYKIRQIEKQARLKEERANAIKLYNTFLNSLSHELRTPIAAIIGATDNLQSNNAQLTQGHKEELVAEISKASLRLNRQVENLLNMSRLDAGFLQPRKDWCDVVELIHEVVRGVEEGSGTHTIHIQNEPDLPLFRLDKVMLEQIIYNIVSNAVLHTSAGTNIAVSAESRAGMLKLQISDDGQGFPEDEIGLVFEKFYRLKHSQSTGTGLGLSIVKGFTEAMGGSIQLQNLQAGGSRFLIQLPAETSYLKV